MKLQDLLSHLHLWNPINTGDLEIVTIENDHRNVKEGSLFVCIKGYTVDGHEFAKQAVHNGACAIIAEKQLDINVPVIIVKDSKRALAILADAFYDHPTGKLKLIGITGTNGKTTTSHLIEKIFQDSYKKTGMIGTIHTKIGDKIYEVKNTTPESLTLQKTFGQMVDEKVEMAVMEVSSHALHMGRVHGCNFNIAVFTNLTQDHLDYHKTMEEYGYAKSLLFSQLGNTFDYTSPKFAVLNVDDPASQQFQQVTAAHVVTYGIDKQADFYAKDIQLTAKGTNFTLITPLGEEKISMKLIGKFSVYNVLAAVCASYLSGISLSSIIQSIKNMEGVSGRFELVDAGQDYAVIVDYAHTPDSLENVLKTIKQIGEKRIFVIVGCGGDRDRSKRPIMARIACEYSTDPIFTSDNPRSEDPLAIIEDMKKGVVGEEYTTILDRRDAINYAISNAKKGDVILIAGKGHETYQTIGSINHDFDDRLVAKEAIRENI